MKVRVFDPTFQESSPAFEPQETPLLGSSEGSLVVQLGPTPGRVPYADVVALAVLRSSERGGEQSFLLLFLNGRPRPLLAAAPRIRLEEFPIRPQSEANENLRQVAIHISRQAGAVLVDRPTLTFLKSGGAPPLVKHRMASLSTSFGRTLSPRSAAAAVSTQPTPPPQPPPPGPTPPPPAPPAFSAHQTRPLPPSVAAAASPPPQPLPRDSTPSPTASLGPTPVSTQPLQIMRPSQAAAAPSPGAPAPTPVLPQEPSAAPVPTSEPSAPVPPPPAPPPPAPGEGGAPAPPTPSAATREAFAPMEVQVFDPAYGAEDPKLRPHEVFMVEGSDRGLRIQPELLGSVDFDDVQALSIFRSSEYGEEKLFLLLLAKSAVRPLLVEAQLIRYTDFPIRACETLAESIRQAVLYFCQKAGRMVLDRSTGRFLQGGGSPPRLESSILAAATAIRQVLPSGPSSPPDPTPRPPAPAPPSTPGPIPGFEAEAFRPALATPAAAGIVPGPLPFGSPEQQPDAPVASVAYGAAPPDSWSAAPSSPAGGAAVPGDAPRAGHSDWQAFSYPVRGLSFLVLVVFVAFTVVSVVLRHNYPSTGTVVALNAVAAWFLPPVMFGIVRDTALGDNTLAELPSFFDVTPRLGDLVSYLLVALVPALAAWGGRELISKTAASLERPLALVVAVAGQALLGLLLFALWMIALGAAAVYNDVTIPLRLDLHFRALVKCWQPLLGIFARLFAFTFLVVCFIVVFMMFVKQPDMGSISGLILTSLPGFALAGYILIDSCHLVGLLFRRHESTLSAIYLYK